MSREYQESVPVLTQAAQPWTVLEGGRRQFGVTRMHIATESLRDWARRLKCAAIFAGMKLQDWVSLGQTRTGIEKSMVGGAEALYRNRPRHDCITQADPACFCKSSSSRLMNLVFKSIGVCLFTGLGLPLLAVAQSAPQDLTGASLEELMNIQVTSVSKKEQSLSKSASSIYVITQDDIRQSGATTVPDLLRMVPGVEVARINANTWAISIRGFNYRYSGKVLVLVDGRTVYTPLFSGVYWDQQSMPLENIDRIEVIRGPGGTVWGANAMNGVINIITKDSSETHGGLVSAVAGSQGNGQALAQYGGSAGPNGSYRAYGRYTTNGNSPSSAADPAIDDQHSLHLGFRSDWNLSHGDKVTLQGDLLGASEGQTITTLFSNRLPNYYTFGDHVRVAAGNVLARWNHLFSDGSETTVQVYYDRYRRFDQGLNYQDTGDFDMQYHFHVGEKHDIVAGFSYRVTDQNWTQGYETVLGSGHRRDNLFSGFIQDEISLTKSLALTMGMKAEHNDYTGYEVEPSVQLIWSPNNRQALWTSVSRAIQQPSWLYAQAQVDEAVVPLSGGGFAIYQISGNNRIAAPVLLNYEIGYRTEIANRFTVDTTVFLADYTHISTVEPLTPFFTRTPAQSHLVLPNVFGSLGNARDYGVEASAHWDVTKWWRISPGMSFLQMSLSRDATSKDTTLTAAVGDSPKYQAQLRTTIKLARNLEWNTSAYYVGRLAIGPVPDYTRLDTRLGWHIGESLDVSITGQSLLSPRHFEFLDALQVHPTETARGFVVGITRRF